MRSVRILLGLLLIALSGAAAAWAPQDGDIVFHTSTSRQSEAIQRATRSPWSHLGVVLLRGGQPYVYEAVQPVRYTPLQAWLDRGAGGRYVVKRLRAPLSAAQVQALHATAPLWHRKDYDLLFGWSDERIYCSELVWKLYAQALDIELAPLARLRDFDLSDPVVSAKLRERYGTRLPLDEAVIAPSAVYDSPLLIEVARR